MKNSTIILCMFLFASCKSKNSSEIRTASPENVKSVTIKLLDSLGFITGKVPDRYDTFFQWTNNSDCGKPCAYEEYRFQSKNLPIAKKTGWFWRGEPTDSIDNFTIVHTAYFPFHTIDDTTSKFIENITRHRKEYLLSEELEPKISSDTIEKIFDRYFYIIVIDLYNSATAQYSKRLFGGTTIKGNVIEFQYKLLTKIPDAACLNFIDESKKLLRTIRISKGI